MAFTTSTRGCANLRTIQVLLSYLNVERGYQVFWLKIWVSNYATVDCVDLIGSDLFGCGACDFGYRLPRAYGAMINFAPLRRVWLSGEGQIIWCRLSQMRLRPVGLVHNVQRDVRRFQDLARGLIVAALQAPSLRIEYLFLNWCFGCRRFRACLLYFGLFDITLSDAEDLSHSSLSLLLEEWLVCPTPIRRQLLHIRAVRNGTLRHLRR